MIREMPHSVTGSLAQGRQVCVIDARLALSRHGLLIVSRLATEFDVWIPGAVFQILRDLPTFQDQTPLDAATQPTEDPYRAAEAAAIGGTVRLWEDFPED